MHAGRVFEDTPTRFVLSDSVLYSGARSCADGKLWAPEGAVFPGAADQPAIPFRIYTVALPHSVRPSFQIQNVLTQAQTGSPCTLKQAFEEQTIWGPQTSRTAWVSEPYFRDGLWRANIHVPLLYAQNGQWYIRQSFQLVVSYGATGSGVQPGKRALASVINPVAARRFGTVLSGRALAQKKVQWVQSSLSGVQWLARLAIGGKDQASFNYDGLYAVSFSELRAMMRTVGRESELDGIPVQSVRLFGASPDTLPEQVGTGAKLADRWKECAIEVIDHQGNGIFDEGDSIRFMGWGTSFWKRLEKAENRLGGSPVQYYYSASPYSFYQYFYLGAAGAGKRLSLLPHGGTAPDIQWWRYQRIEKDLFLRDLYFGSNHLEETTGKEWFWAWSGESSVIIPPSDFQSLWNMPGRQGDSAWLGVSFVPPRSTASSPGLSGQSLSARMGLVRHAVRYNGALLDAPLGIITGGTFLYGLSMGSSSSLEVELLPNTTPDRLDGVTLAYRWDPAQAQRNEWLLPGDYQGRLRIPVPSGAKLLKMYNGVPQGWLSVVSGYAQDSMAASGDTRYLLVQKPDSLKAPAFLEPLLPRNQGESEPLDIPSQTEYLIIAPEKLRVPALQLKEFRESGAAVTTVKTAVVLAEDIYRDLGGGQYSPVALRDYLQYARARCPDLRWVLLAADGHYDYRRMRSGSPENLLPPYEREDMSSDDFFVVLDSGEVISYGNYDLDLAIGRLPVNSVEEFTVYLQKVKQYEQVSLMDNDIWRNTLLLLADDAMQRDQVDVSDHTIQQERISALVDSNAYAQGFSVDIKKLYLVEYERDASYQKPEATRDLLSLMNQGALFTLYFGHGSSTVWSDEGLLKVNSIFELDNQPRYTILGSFACTVGRFDESQVSSLSEVFMKTAQRGAIASIGAMRETYGDPNELLAKNMLKNAMFTPGITLGEAIQRAKQYNSASIFWTRYNNEKYVLLGEPILSMPNFSLDLTVDQNIDTLQALQKVTVEGSATASQGKLRLQVMEGARSRTLTQDQGNGLVYQVSTLMAGSPIHSETMPIEGGRFRSEFITPRKISFGDTAAQIRLWAWIPGESLVGRGLLSKIAISGTSTYADSIVDLQPPSILVYPCTQSGVSAPYAEGQKVSLEIPACLEVVIEDSTGIDYREEADEGITFEVPGFVEPWHPWPYLEQNGRRAVARMQFGTRFTPGDYEFQVMAQDILGNISYRTMALELASTSRQGLADVFNVPNPMGKRGTTFYFKNLSGERRHQVTIQIFDQNGKLVQVLRNAQSGVTHWDGRDRHGRLLANGLYHYAVQNAVFPAESGGKRQLFVQKQKLVISR